MGWKDILKSEETEMDRLENKLMSMSKDGKLRDFLKKAAKEIEDYALPLLKKKFPEMMTYSIMNSNAFKDIKERVKFKLGELTIDPRRLSLDDGINFGDTIGIVEADIYFNNVIIGEIAAYQGESGPQYHVDIQYKGYYGGDPEDVAIVELYKKIKGE
tara:strand:+ start:1495 stop:1968 length:474 start_codon:yes stop_codon:yes gene_type:complete